MILQPAVLEPLKLVAATAAIAVALNQHLTDRRAQERGAMMGAPIGQETPLECVAGGGDVEARRR